MIGVSLLTDRHVKSARHLEACHQQKSEHELKFGCVKDANGPQNKISLLRLQPFRDHLEVIHALERNSQLQSLNFLNQAR